MDHLIKKEGLIHAMLVIVLAALFGLWYLNTLQHAPRKTHPGGPPPEMMQGQAPPPPPGSKPDRGPVPLKPEAIILIVGVLVIVMANVAVRAYFRSAASKERLKEMENENLNSQLETLRYQINPHFFMNTLNNIHALVDIDPEKAKESIEEFSKLMRIVLYEGASPTIPLQKEVEYLNHYISLMRLRYPQSVKISTSFPKDCSGISVPPLLMASFVENAFKHGISYEQDSFVHVSVVKEDDKLVFRCANSRIPGSDPVQHGIGLENTRKRLDLLYGSNYTLNIDESEKVYDIFLILPL